MVRWSVVTPVPVAPASSHTSLRADIPPVLPLPPIVSGLFATIVTLPPAALPGLPLAIQPEVVKAPVLRMLISPDTPLLVAVRILTLVFSGVPAAPKPVPMPLKADASRPLAVMVAPVELASTMAPAGASSFTVLTVVSVIIGYVREMFPADAETVIFPPPTLLSPVIVVGIRPPPVKEVLFRALLLAK